jgi:hypothetical protein
MTMIPFICATCGHFDIDSADCSSCASHAAEAGSTDAAS